MRRLVWIGVAALAAALPRAAGSAGAFRAHGASMLLAPGESELKLFHNLYTQTRTYDAGGRRSDPGPRSTWYTATAAVRRGWRPRVNVGLELTVRAVRDDTRLPDFRSRRGLTAVTPCVQAAVLEARPSFTLETGLRVPLAARLEGDERDPFLDFDEPVWSTKGFDEVGAGERIRIYAEAGARVRLAGDESQWTTPFKAIPGFAVTPRWKLELPLELSRDWLGASEGSYYVQGGVGVKGFVGADAELEVLWTTFPAGRRSGAGQTFNVGLRLVR
ncbi:MAG: hypothetical protein ACT4PE_16330 [Candidatus Eiseniibacteriota bacterium]